MDDKMQNPIKAQPASDAECSMAVADDTAVTSGVVTLLTF